MLLCLLPVVIMSQVLPSFTESAYVSLLLSVVVLLPVPMMALLVYRVMSNAMNSETDGDGQLMDLQKAASNSAVSADDDIEMVTKSGGTAAGDIQDEGGMTRIDIAGKETTVGNGRGDD